MSDQLNSGTDRRTFIKQATGAALITGMDARSYRRVLGTNDRIGLAQWDAGTYPGTRAHRTAGVETDSCRNCRRMRSMEAGSRTIANYGGEGAFSISSEGAEMNIPDRPWRPR